MYVGPWHHRASALIMIMTMTCMPCRAILSRPSFPVSAVVLNKNMVHYIHVEYTPVSKSAMSVRQSQSVILLHSSRARRRVSSSRHVRYAGYRVTRDRDTYIILLGIISYTRSHDHHQMIYFLPAVPLYCAVLYSLLSCRL